jgi:hypothetical protein
MTVAQHQEWEQLSRYSYYAIPTGLLEVRIPPEKKRFFCIPEASKSAMPPPPTSYSLGTGVMYPEYSLQTRYGAHPPPYSLVMGLFPRHIASTPAMGRTQLHIRWVRGYVPGI